LPHGTTQGGQHRPGHKDLVKVKCNPQSLWKIGFGIFPTNCVAEK
jgi:hypothetical protein